MNRLFNNEYIDKLIFNEEPYKQAKTLRKFVLNKNRKELAKIIGISAETIRRYESHWNKQRIPPWYFTLLRFFCGDLSFFKKDWINATINQNGKLSTDYFKYVKLSPSDMNIQYSRVYNQAQREKMQLIKKINRLENLLKNQSISANNDKVVQLFKH